jgi:hypothetical protein
MSNQSDAKAAQGYEPKPVPQTCMNCGHFKLDLALPKWKIERNLQCPGRYGQEYAREKNLRCGLGGFAVKKTATCNAFVRKEPA